MVISQVSAPSLDWVTLIEKFGVLTGFLVYMIVRGEKILRENTKEVRELREAWGFAKRAELLRISASSHEPWVKSEVEKMITELDEKKRDAGK